MELNLTEDGVYAESDISGNKSTEEKKKLEPIVWSDHKPEIILSVIISIGFAAFILLNLVTTQILFRLLRADNSLQLIYKEVSWIINLLPIFGIILVAVIIYFFGRKAGLISTIFPALILFTLFYFSTTRDLTGSDKLWIAIIQRSLYLIGVGGFYLVAPLQLCELLSPSFRDFFAFLPISFCFGANLLFDLLRTLTPTVEIITVITFILLIVLIFWRVPESPYWLVRRWEREAAGNVFKNLFGAEYDTETKIRKIGKLSADNKKPFCLVYCTKKTWKPIGLLLTLIFLHNCTGESTIRFFTPKILAPVSLVEILANLLPVLAGLVVLVVARKSGKRTLLIISGTIIFIALIVKAGAKYIELNDVHDDYYNTTVAFDAFSVILFSVGYAVGYQFVVWLLLGELLTARGRELSAALLMVFHTLTRFGVSQLFHYGFDYEHIPYFYGIFAFITLFGIAFIYFCVPDTNNKPLEEIQTAADNDDD